MQNYTVDALVITGTETNWARHYLRAQGYHTYDVESILLHLTEGDRLTGRVYFSKHILQQIDFRR